jgi:hypothetical protein
MPAGSGEAGRRARPVQVMRTPDPAGGGWGVTAGAIVFGNEQQVQN